MTDDTDDFVLNAPPAPVEVTPEKAVAKLDEQMAPATRTQAQTNAARIVDAIVATNDPTDKTYNDRVDALVNLGAEDIRTTSQVANRMLDRPAAQNVSGSAQAHVGQSLVDLRLKVTELDPNRNDLTGPRKLFKWLPGGNKVEAYLARYQSAQSQIDAIINALDAGQTELRADNEAIDSERTIMWESLGRLAEYREMAVAIDEGLTAKIRDLRATGDPDDATQADWLERDALYAIRQRTQDIVTQMAVATQGYLALDLVRQNNTELIRGVDRAQNSTVAALRTAVMVTQALSAQGVVLDQVTTLNDATSELLVGTSETLRAQGARIQQQAASATVNPDALGKAFANVFATMDELDKFRADAAHNMAVSTGVLERQVVRSREYLERSRRRELPPA